MNSTIFVLSTTKVTITEKYNIATSRLRVIQRSVLAKRKAQLSTMDKEQSKILKIKGN